MSKRNCPLTAFEVSNTEAHIAALNLLAEAKAAELSTRAHVVYAEMALAYSNCRLALTRALQNDNCTEADRDNIEDYLMDAWSTEDGNPTPYAFASVCLSTGLRSLIEPDCDALAAAVDAYCGAAFGCAWFAPRDESKKWQAVRGSGV